MSSFFFFFSSRRRHTRSLRDWSSDVCSSDLSGWPSGLAVGRARYTMLCAPDGGILDDLIVYRQAEERFLVVANAANAAVVLAELTERCSGGAVVTDESAGTGLISIQGPNGCG